MQINFYKYQGTGNDFVMIDNRQRIFPKNNTKLVAQLCDRKFGIGADGLILLEDDKKADFRMVYYNADGGESTMCGNGGRCLVAFAKFLGIVDNHCTFMAVDGLHSASINAVNGDVALQMIDVVGIDLFETYSFLDTGSPHHVQLIENLAAFDVAKEGARLRYGKYGKKGSNINFVEPLGADKFSVRTYERGVEAETLSCGTGVTAVALAMHQNGLSTDSLITLQTPGGTLQVKFNKDGAGYRDIHLIGPAKQVFSGEIAITL